MRKSTYVLPVFEDIDDERALQDDKWGEQNHPDGTGGQFYVDMADLFRRNTDRSARAGSLTWRDVLTEEVYEAYAETDPAALRAELVQVAAVAAAWVEAIDRRTQP